MAINVDTPGVGGLGSASRVRQRDSGDTGASNVADAARTGRPGATDATGAPAEGGSERVSLTDDARRAAELERTMEREFFVDEGRIDAIRSAIRNGEYSIDPQRIADKLLQLEQGL